MEENPKQLTKVIKLFTRNLIFEILISMILMFILAIILSKTDVEERIINPSIIGISAFSIMIGAVYVSRKANIKGIIIRYVKWNFIYVSVIFGF